MYCHHLPQDVDVHFQCHILPSRGWQNQVETSCSGSAWYVKNYCFHKSKNFVGFVRRGGNDFLSVTIDLWSRPRVAVISARARGYKFLSETSWSQMCLSAHWSVVKGRLAKLTIYFLQLLFNVRVHNGGFFCSLRLKKCTSITIHRTDFQCWLYHRVTKISLLTPRKAKVTDGFATQGFH